MANIERRRADDGTYGYRVRIRLKGHPSIYRTFHRKSDAKRWAQSTEAAIRERRFFPTAEAERRTFGELAERFIAEKLPLRAKRDHRMLKNQLLWWRDQLGDDTPLATITPARIVEARDRLSRGDSPSGERLSPATVKRYLALLSRVFAVASKEWFWVESNPCRKVPRPTEPRGRVRYLSSEERASLLEACQKSRDPRLYPLVLLALATGARAGEMLSLRWDDVDLDQGIAVLHHTKNHERRSVPVTGVALEELRKLRERKPQDSEVVFVSSRGLATFPRKPWYRALAKAGLKDFHFHDLRHTAASYLAMSGATLAEIAEVLGHKTLAMVKRYAHLTDAHTRSVVERMNQQFLKVG